MKEITKDEFLRLTHTPEDCWIFIGAKSHRYFIDEKTEIVYLVAEGGDMRRFKRMEKCGEIWESRSTWSIWETWAAD